MWLRTSAPGLAKILAELPDAYRIVDLGPAELVAGPTGLFLVGDGRRNARAVARRLAALAARCREILCERSVAPFVDVLVVSSPRQHEVDGATLVPPHMLIDTLTSGAVMIDEELAADLVAALEERRADLD